MLLFIKICSLLEIINEGKDISYNSLLDEIIRIESEILFLHKS